jgi:RNA recognition motif. (a.k.a. RRM, RBD, or RNP domain)
VAIGHLGSQVGVASHKVSHVNVTPRVTVRTSCCRSRLSQTMWTCQRTGLRRTGQRPVDDCPGDSCWPFATEHRRLAGYVRAASSPSVRLSVRYSACLIPCGNGVRAGGGDADSTTIFVKGFDKYLGEDGIREALMEAFGSCGTVTSVRLPTDRETGELKGIGFVEFETPAEKARDGLGVHTAASCLFFVYARWAWIPIKHWMLARVCVWGGGHPRWNLVQHVAPCWWPHRVVFCIAWLTQGGEKGSSMVLLVERGFC